MTIKDSVMGLAGRILVSLGCCHTGCQINFKHYFDLINNEWSSFFQSQNQRMEEDGWLLSLSLLANHLNNLFLVPRTLDAETLMHLITKKGNFLLENITMF